MTATVAGLRSREREPINGELLMNALEGGIGNFLESYQSRAMFTVEHAEDIYNDLLNLAELARAIWMLEWQK